ncbi:uncharacterized protein C8Q71DRAFT_731468 [Rhodofomes roseus]|uniref:DUF4050 domain-containing protein n=1 Tax=Rhodofomes roseus TaxID=34475 RepID=A0ABQ8KXW6_9APHY|nr:uncharacterized protein C8Q71DRAFT_731468 [Rhodofomes roseus]KAH9844144.1 hypothetical protein C8Q71DRAFT_731468 [Rhodofomes roseus]
MAPSPVKFRTPESLDHENWRLPSPALRSHPIPHEDNVYCNDVVFPQATAAAVAPFEQRLASTQMPPPGPSYFQARRAIWWEPVANTPPSEEVSMTHRRLEDLLSKEDATESDEAWRAGLGKVYRALVSGARLKKRMPLNMVIQIIMSGWIRDGTWPRGASAPEPDDELSPPPEDTGYMAPSHTTTPDAMSTAKFP